MQADLYFPCAQQHSGIASDKHGFLHSLNYSHVIAKFLIEGLPEHTGPHHGGLSEILRERHQFTSHLPARAYGLLVGLSQCQHRTATLGHPFERTELSITTQYHGLKKIAVAIQYLFLCQASDRMFRLSFTRGHLGSDEGMRKEPDDDESERNPSDSSANPFTC
ncbi:hypothetical protein PM082_013917 [Marasmius tenuissimus]|nr:hypothetical protein PM082_013917 [Marasmius tenuissimus]